MCVDKLNKNVREKKMSVCDVERAQKKKKIIINKSYTKSC